VDLPHENHRQMRHRIFIVAHPGFCFLFLMNLINFQGNW